MMLRFIDLGYGTGFTFGPLSSKTFHISLPLPPDITLRPPNFSHRPGITLRPLDASHFDTVKRFWSYAARAADADVIIRDGLLAGLSVGAFIDDDDATTPTSDGLVSWCVLNHNGSLAFMHTLESHRRRGLGGLVLTKLTEICQQRGYPCSASTVAETKYGIVSALTKLGYNQVGDVLVGGGAPSQTAQ